MIIPDTSCHCKLQCFGTFILSNSVHFGVTKLLSVSLFFLLGCQERSLQCSGEITVWAAVHREVNLSTCIWNHALEIEGTERSSSSQQEQTWLYWFSLSDMRKMQTEIINIWKRGSIGLTAFLQCGVRYTGEARSSASPWCPTRVMFQQRQVALELL